MAYAIRKWGGSGCQSFGKLIRRSTLKIKSRRFKAPVHPIHANILYMCIYAHLQFTGDGDVKKLFVGCRGFAFGLSAVSVSVSARMGAGVFRGQIRTKDVMPLRRLAERGRYRVNGEDCKAILWPPQ